MLRKKKKQGSSSNKKTKFHQELEGFDLKVSAFGEMQSSFSIDKLNHFLDQQVEDKKLQTVSSEEH